jgi:hypothetical protein
MPDIPDGGDWGCVNVPVFGRVCASDYVEDVQTYISGIIRDTETGTGDRSGGVNGGGSVSNGTRNVQGCPPVVVPIRVIARAQVPRGYVVVIDPATNQKVGMLKSVAKNCKLWKPARKPPISASDWRCLQKANSTVKKLDRVVKMSNKITGKASLTRSRTKR